MYQAWTLEGSKAASPGEPIDELQEVHFDVILPHPENDRLAAPFALVSDTSLIAEVEVALDPHITAFRSLFEPRLVKPR